MGVVRLGVPGLNNYNMGTRWAGRLKMDQYPDISLGSVIQAFYLNLDMFLGVVSLGQSRSVRDGILKAGREKKFCAKKLDI